MALQKDVRVRFRRMQPNDELFGSAQKWAAAIAEATLWAPSLEVEVLVDRCAPQWGASTTVHVELRIGDQRVVEAAQRQDPHEALQESFKAAAQRIREYQSLVEMSTPCAGLYLG